MRWQRLYHFALDFAPLSSERTRLGGTPGPPRGTRVLPATRFLGSVAAFLVSVGCWMPASAAAPTALPALRRAVADLVAQPRYAAARWGLHVVSLATGEARLAHDADRLFVPASNTKLFTAALALDRLGPNFRIRTSLLAHHAPNARGVLRGDLIVFGRGDFSFSDHFRNGRVDAALDPLVAAVRAAGIRRIRGDLVADPRFFQAPAHGAGWEGDDFQYGYAAEVSALNVHDNVVRVHVRPGPVTGAPVRAFLEPATDFVTLDNHALTGPPGSPAELSVTRPGEANRIRLDGHLPRDDPGRVERVAVHRPVAWFVHLLADALRKAGLRLDGRPRVTDENAPRPDQAPEWRELGGVDSPPLRELLTAMLKPSQNQYAQLLWLQVGARALAAAKPPEASPNRRLRAAGDFDPAPTDTAARRAMQAFLEEIGVPTGAAFFEEGSGLSRRNLVTPRAITTLLRQVASRPWGGVFRAALPAPGESGTTLKDRLTTLPPGTELRAKTGYLRHTYALSGYLTPAGGKPLAFALLLNQAAVPPDAPSPREDLDALVARLARRLGPRRAALHR